MTTTETVANSAGAVRHPGRVIRRVHPVMGTMVSFDVRVSDAERSTALVALARACARLDRADAVFSTWRPNSPMSLLRRNMISLAEAPAVIAVVLELCAVARDLSGGWFDPWAMPGGVDPTGLVKGWAADQALRELRAAGVRAAMVSAGGDLATFGGPEPGLAWRIGVRDPWAIDRIACVVESPGAVATSGCYERGLHVVDPQTGLADARCVSATVVGPELWLADALATGLLVAGEVGLAHIEALEGYEAYVISERGEAATTGSFPVAE
ncbi:MAG TPA: FAD:protein FMN transferase [Acidimicrobiales bacterium]|nr:FAD:protein FMN transferase [Acidimicrobiales bacterium]